MNPLNPRERRLIALALLVLAIAVVWLAVVSPIVNGFAARDAERKNLLATYRRDQRLLDSIPVWRARAEAQKRGAAAFGLFAPSQVQAQDMLKQRVIATLTAAGAPAPTVQDLASDLPAGWIGARADTELTQTQLNESLRRLESEQPYVVVEYISVSADRAYHSGHAGTLDVRIEVSTPLHLTAAQ